MSLSKASGTLTKAQRRQAITQVCEFSRQWSFIRDDRIKIRVYGAEQELRDWQAQSKRKPAQLCQNSSLLIHIQCLTPSPENKQGNQALLRSRNRVSIHATGASSRRTKNLATAPLCWFSSRLVVVLNESRLVPSRRLDDICRGFGCSSSYASHTQRRITITWPC